MGDLTNGEEFAKAMATCDRCAKSSPALTHPDLLPACTCPGGMMILNGPPIAPTHEDRIAVAAYYRHVMASLQKKLNWSDDVVERTVKAIIAGRWDADEAVQAFARHRARTEKSVWYRAWDLVRGTNADLCTTASNAYMNIVAAVRKKLDEASKVLNV